MYLLDTNICAYIINNKPPQVRVRLDNHHTGEVAISSLTLAELMYGVEKSSKPSNNLSGLEKFLSGLTILSFDAAAATAYGRIRRGLEQQGQSIGPLDTLIAAHALSLTATLVTNNTREFSRVPGLSLENWAEG